MAPFRKEKYFEPPTVDVSGTVQVKYEYIDETKKKRLFTAHNRRVVKIWKKYGLVGLAFLTPILISIPIGTVIAAHYVHNKRKLFLYMFVAIVFWSLVMNFFWRFGSPGNHQPKATSYTYIK